MSGLPRAVVDTNVLVAAVLKPAGTCGRLLNAAAVHRWQLIVSPLLLAELEAVLTRPKFHRWLTAAEAQDFVANVRVLAQVVPAPPTSAERHTTDPGDDYLVALARVARVDLLVSGDVHLTDLGNPDPPVVTPAQFMARLGND